MLQWFTVDCAPSCRGSRYGLSTWTMSPVEAPNVMYFCHPLFGYTGPMAKPSSHILELAKRGAELRFRELVNELKQLTSGFPHLRDSLSRDELPVNFILRRGRDNAERKAEGVPKRRKMSAKARKAISDAQKARWAKQKASASTTQTVKAGRKANPS
jgi:hypothetical protein